MTPAPHPEDNRPDPLEPIPLVVLSGFLGAGKTTRLNRWLTHAALAETLVIINEFGEIGLDHLLVEDAPGEIVLMAAGCLCCSIRGDLVATLEDLLRRRDNHRIRFFRQVIIETTGLADPAPILQSVLQHPYLSKRFRIAGVVTLVDAFNGPVTLVVHPEARRQVALADLVLITKADLETGAGLEPLLATLAELNPVVRPIVGDEVFDPATLFAERFDATRGPAGALLGWLGEHEESPPSDRAASHAAQGPGEIASFTFVADQAVSEGALSVFREALRILHGPRLLRAKGLVQVKEHPEQPVVFHHVQSVAHPAVRLARWPSRDRRTRLVFITQGIARETIARFWEALVASDRR